MALCCILMTCGHDFDVDACVVDSCVPNLELDLEQLTHFIFVLSDADAHSEVL